jgi:hypothetical protein
LSCPIKKSAGTAWAQTHNISLAHAVPDPDGTLLKVFGAHAVPADFFIGQDNLIHFHEMGYTSLWGYKIRLWLTAHNL